MLKRYLFPMLFIVTITTSVVAEKPTKEAIMLDLKDKNVKRFEASQSQIGFTSTRVFYTLNEQRIIVVIHIDNTKKEFPVTGKVCQFEATATPEGLAKWLNNQHSDGLYPEVPEPKSTVKLPAEACQTLSSKLLGQKTVLDTSYNHYSVEIKLAETKVTDQLRLPEFKDTVNVYAVAK